MHKSALLAVAMLASASVFALGVTPTRLVFEHSESSTQKVRVAGDSTTDTAVEFRIVERQVTNRKVRVGPATDDCLSISIPQTFLPAKGNQTISVSAEIDNPVCLGKSFYLVVETLPIQQSSSEGQAQLRIAPSFFVPVHIRPGNHKDVMVNLIRDGEIASIVNTGSGAVLLSGIDFQFRHGETKTWHTLSGRSLALLINADALVAGETREIRLSEVLPAESFDQIRVSKAHQKKDLVD